MKAISLCILFYDSATGGVPVLLTLTQWSNSDALKDKEVLGCRILLLCNIFFQFLVHSPCIYCA